MPCLCYTDCNDNDGAMVWRTDNNSAYSSKVCFPGTNGEKRILIADLSLHKSIAQELRAILPGTVVAVQPLLNGTRRLYTMFPDFKQYPYVLPGYRYNSLADLQATLEEKVIKPAEEKAKELERR